MTKKPELQIIQPRKAIGALNGFNEDVNYLLTAARNSVSFLNNGSIDPDKARKAVAPMLDEAVQRVARWYEAD